ncbi:peptidase M20 [Clostridia bacterium]|nr:peptidase M20 [Clostridia bacterium]
MYEEHLSRMLKVKTIAGDSFAEFESLLAELYPLTFARLERIPIRNALLLRWKTSNPGAVLLMAHADVVPAAGNWTRDPWGGEIDGGKIWGRGAMDNKAALLGILEAVEGLLSDGYAPPHDVYVLSSYNEETMGDGAVGARDWFAENGVRLALVSDEGGYVMTPPIPGVSGVYSLLGAGEKGVANIRFTAKSGGGHASAPPRDTPLARLAAFITEVENDGGLFPRRVTPIIRGLMDALSPGLTDGEIIGRLSQTPQGEALIRATCAFTMAAGSKYPNVIDGASVTANVRFVSHQPSEEVIGALESAAHRHGLDAEVLYKFESNPDVDMSIDMFQSVKHVTERVFPDFPAVPWVMTAGTDSRHFAWICPCVVRFNPTFLTPGQRGTMHGADENINVGALPKAVEFYRELIKIGI